MLNAGIIFVVLGSLACGMIMVELAFEQNGWRRTKTLLLTLVVGLVLIILGMIFTKASQRPMTHTLSPTPKVGFFIAKKKRPALPGVS